MFNDKEKVAKFTSKLSYFTVTVSSKLMSDTLGKHVHPSYGDVILLEEKAYGVGEVLGSRKKSKDWELDLLLHELKKEKFSVTKSFKAPYGD